MTEERFDVAVVGGGPAGMVAGCLLARAGLRTLVLERNADFEREFRGEILQPRFHQAMREAGLYEHVAAYPHEEVERAQLFFRGRPLGHMNLRRLAPRSGTTWWMTQPILLRALQEYGQGCPHFTLRFGADVRDISGTTLTVQQHGGGETRIEARVIVGADGRFSAVRRLCGFEVAYDHHDMDVAWFILERPADYAHAFGVFLTPRHNYLILPKYPNQLQCGIVYRPGEFSAAHRQPLAALKAELAAAHPVFRRFAAEVESFAAFRPLRGNVAQVRDWARDGVVLIGDAAHTCSPAGGIGVAVAVESAIVAARVIEGCFAAGDFSRARLARIQALRRGEIRRVHQIQRRAARGIIGGPPWVRRAAVFVIRWSSRTGLMPVLARELLTRQRPLPSAAACRA